MPKTNELGFLLDVHAVSTKVVDGVEYVVIEVPLVPVTYKPKDGGKPTEHLAMLDSRAKATGDMARVFQTQTYGSAVIRALDIKPADTNPVNTLESMTKAQLLELAKAMLKGDNVPNVPTADTSTDLDLDDVTDDTPTGPVAWPIPPFTFDGVRYEKTLTLSGHQLGGLKKALPENRVPKVCEYLLAATGAPVGEKSFTKRAMLFLTHVGIDYPVPADK